jgi:pimeloyl-ACP methyl ester carboxylesterase
MAARFWRRILVCALLLALVTAAALAVAWSLSAAAALTLALAVLLAQPLLLVLMSVLRARTSAPPGAPRAGFLRTLRTWLGETAHFSRAVLVMCTNPRPRPPSPAAPSRPPVLLIHGILCNRGVWGALQGRLRAAGFGTVLAVNLEPLFADIEEQAAGVQPQLLALHRLSHGTPVAIVAHSMGGLVARVLLRDLGATVIARIVTLASPHHGTSLVAGLRWPATRQMAPASPWLRALNAAQEGRFDVPLVSIYSLEDNLVAPAASARLQGAGLHELRGVGHLEMLRSAQALDCAVAALGGAVAQ